MTAPVTIMMLIYFIILFAIAFGLLSSAVIGDDSWSMILLYVIATVVFASLSALTLIHLLEVLTC